MVGFFCGKDAEFDKLFVIPNSFRNLISRILKLVQHDSLIQDDIFVSILRNICRHSEFISESVFINFKKYTFLRTHSFSFFFDEKRKRTCTPRKRKTRPLPWGLNFISFVYKTSFCLVKMLKQS